MSHLDILLPFGLPPPELASDLLRECKTPSLALFLSRAAKAHVENFEGHMRSLPHEIWLSRKFGLGDALSDDNSPPLAPLLMQQYGLPTDDKHWFIVQPVYFHVARDHLVLTDIRQLSLSDNDSKTLFDAAQPSFEEAGKTLTFGDAHTWFMCADEWQDLRTASPDAASGHNIDIWLPQGSAEREWRKLQNEVQMQWHANAQEISQTHNNPISANALWLWGCGKAQNKQQGKIYTDVFNLSGWMQAFTAQNDKHHQNSTVADVISASPKYGLLVLDNLMSSALTSDWGTWLQQMQRLEEEWFAPLLAALKSKSIDQITLIFSHNSKLVEWHITRTSLLKFWAKPSLKQLLP